MSTKKINIRSPKYARIAAKVTAIAVITPSTKADVFVAFQSQVSSMQVTAYAGGWEDHKPADFMIECSVWEDEAATGWDVVVESLLGFLTSLSPETIASDIADDVMAEITGERES